MRKELFKARKLDDSYFRMLQLSGYDKYDSELLKLNNLKFEVINEIENPLTGGTMNQYFVKCGNLDSKKVVGWFSTHHGMEKAGACTVLQVLREINNPQTNLMKKFLKEAKFVSIPVIDPFGYEVLADLDINLHTKKEERDPADQEQLWGNTNEYKRYRTKESESVFKTINSEFEGAKDKTLEGLIIDSHETVINEMEWALKGKMKPAFMVGDSVRRNQGLVIVNDTIKYNIARAAVSNLFKYNKQPYLITGLDEYAEKSMMFPQMKNKEDGIVEISDIWRELGFNPFTIWAKSQGINGLTFESFMKSCSSRVEEHMIAGEGAIKSFMGYSTNLFVQDGLKLIDTAKNALKKTIFQGIFYTGIGYFFFGIYGAILFATLPIISYLNSRRGRLNPERILTHLANEDISFYPEWIDEKIKNSINNQKTLKKTLKECYKKTSKNMVLLEGDEYEMMFTKYGFAVDCMGGGFEKLVNTLHPKDAFLLRKFNYMRKMMEEKQKMKKPKGFFEKLLSKSKEKEEEKEEI